MVEGRAIIPVEIDSNHGTNGNLNDRCPSESRVTT